MYSKSQIKWSQSAIKLSTSSNNMDYVVFQNMIHDLTTTSSTNEQKLILIKQQIHQLKAPHQLTLPMMTKTY